MDSLKRDLKEFQMELETLKKTINELQGQDPNSNSRERKTELINKLHLYNDFKDSAQYLIGYIANIEGKTCKQVHIELGLPLND